jgi:hypothetical protein
MDTIQTPTKRNSLIGLMVLVLLLAATLRIYHITQQSIWFDEAFAWNIIIQDDMFPRISTDTHPPLYYVLLRGWVALAGDSALALRYLSALTSIMTVAFVYGVGVELSHGRQGWAIVPVLSALMIALSDAEIFLAQEARNYSLYTFFACWSMWFYLRWLRRGGWQNGLLWAIGTSGLAYTHYQGLFIPAIQGLHVILFLRGSSRVRGVGWLILSGLPLLPWFLLVTIPQAQNAIDNSLPFAIPTNWETFLHLRDRYFGAIWALSVGVMLLGLWTLSKDRTRRAWGDTFLLAMWLLLPFCVLFFGNLFAALLTERKLLIIVPAIALMMGIGINLLSQPARGLVIIAIVLYGVTSVDYYRVKEPWDVISAPALALGQSGDLYLAQVEVGQYPMRYYWERHMPEGAVFATFPFLGDATLAPTTDHPTFYQGYLQGDLIPYNQAQKTGDVATAWVVFWSGDATVLSVLEANGYQRTFTQTTDHIGNEIALYRYDFLPEEAQVTFTNGLVLQAVETDIDALRIDLWWTTEHGIDGDYTTSAGLLDANGRLVAQWDSSPSYTTSSLTPEDVVYDGKSLVLADGIDTLPSGDYTVIIKVYLWTPDGIIDIPTSNGEDYFSSGTLTLRP